MRKEVLHLYENAFGLIAHGLSLRRVQIRVQVATVLRTIDIEQGIIHGQISATEATSLMNDAGYACEIGRRLIQAIQSLYASTTPDAPEARSHHEIQGLYKKQSG